MKRINVEKIPDEFFVRARQVKDIRKAHILPKQKRKRGEPDVIVKSPFGNVTKMNRRELVNNFSSAKGKPIHLGSWKNREYVVIGNKVSQSTFYVIHINKKVNIKELDNKDVYLMCIEDEGGINKSEAIVIDSKVFKKMFSIEEKLNIAGIRSKVRQLKKMKGENTPINLRKTDELTTKSREDTLYAERRLVKNGVLVGFVLSDKTGREKKISLSDVIQLIKQHKVSGTEIIYNADGGVQIVGDGIAGLPVENIK